MQRTVTHHIFLADNVSSMSKSKAADIHICLIMRIQNLSRLLAVEEAIQSTAVFIGKFKFTRSLIIVVD